MLSNRIIATIARIRSPLGQELARKSCCCLFLASRSLQPRTRSFTTRMESAKDTAGTEPHMKGPKVEQAHAEAGEKAGAAAGAPAAAAAGAASDLPSFPFARPADAPAEPPREFAELRSKCPVAKARLFDGSEVWLITTMKELQASMADPRLSKVRTHPGFPELVPGAKAAIEGREPSFVDMDPPDHTRFRAMFAAPFEAQAVAALRPAIRAIASRAVDELKAAAAKAGEGGGAGGKFAVDLRANFSLPVAYRTIYEILGVPPEEGEELSRNVAVRTSGSSTARDAAAAQQSVLDYMSGLVDKRAADPSGNDLISRVAATDLKEGRISRDQLVAHAFLLLVAGNATVASMFDLGLVELLRRPEQLAALRGDLDGLLRPAVEEMCRYHTASAFALRRVALEETPLGPNATARPGDGVIALNQSANRDAAAFERPDDFDVRRAPPPRNVAFGWGPHECIARELSLVELEEGFRALLTALPPSLRLAVPFEALEWSDPTRDLGLAAVPVTW